MTFAKSSWASLGAVSLFVSIWGSAAIFTRWGLDHASASALLIVRFALALGCLGLVAAWRRRWLPAGGERRGVALTGLLLIGGYSICYFQAMAQGITPGVMATLLGIQPILTLLLVERRLSPKRLAGLLIALCGLVLVVYQSLVVARFSPAGLVLALGALCCMTAGAIRQKRSHEHPAQVLPLQYAVSLLGCLLLVPFQPLRLDWSLDLLGAALWLGLVVSVLAQLLLYRMIRSGNLVNVTSLFYLVPVVTAALDYGLLGNALPGASLLGMAAILAGLALVFRARA